MTDSEIPLTILLKPENLAELKALALQKQATLENIVEQALTQYIADQSLDGSGWSRMFENLVHDDHQHLNTQVKAADLIAQREEKKRLKRNHK